MKANELRIGNFAKSNCEEIIEILEIHSDGVYIKNSYGSWFDDLDEIQPIELNEEVLLKIGFKKERQLISNLFYLDYETDVDNIIRVKYVIYPKAPSLLKITTSQCGNYECFEFMKRGIRYLHELQNAYYCLIGQELEVEL